LLRGLASVLANVLPTDTNLPDSPLAALEVATAMLSHKDEDVRVGAAQVIGISAALLGKSRTDKVINDVVFQTSDDHEEDSSFFSAAASMITAGTEDDKKKKKLLLLHRKLCMVEQWLVIFCSKRNRKNCLWYTQV
jgi:hypothetical protein